jgi:hypothetical protein
MNRLVLFLAAMLCILGIFVAGCSKESDSKALSVRGITTNSEAYKGTITITGAVAMVSPTDPKMFAIMDLDDVKNNVPLPQRVFMQVRYEGGPRPTGGDKVNITGSFKENSRYFEATKIKLRK